MPLDVPPATIAALLSEASKSPKPLLLTPIAVVAAPAIVMPLADFKRPKDVGSSLPAFA